MRKNKRKGLGANAPCITARIDRFLFSRGMFRVTKLVPHNGLTDAQDHFDENSCPELREATSLSDHAQLFIEVTMNAGLKRGQTASFVNDMHTIRRTPKEQERYDRLAQAEEQTYPEAPTEEVEEPQQDIQEKMELQPKEGDNNAKQPATDGKT